VVWTRLFVVVIGNTVFSVSAILSVFMAGLALGSRLAGRAIDRRPLPLVRTYATLEAGIGAYNLLLPLLLKAANPLFGALYNAALDSFWVLTFGRLAVVLLLLIVPATLMGATLPILIRFYTENILNVGHETGRVYSANTWGAAAGTAVAGFLLVPYAGVTLTLGSAVAANFLIAALAWTLSRSQDATFNTEAAGTESSGPRIILIAMLLSGFAALVDEVAWTRVLGLVVGPTTYAFTLMLTSMIVGLGLGAALGARLAAKRIVTINALAWIEIAVGVTSLGIVPAFGRMPVWIGQIVTKYVEQFGMIQGIEFLIFFALMLFPTTLLGMTFPIASRLYAKSDSLLGSEVSAVYAFNTVGGILGSLIAGFLLIPLIGSQWALVVAAVINGITGVLLSPPPLRWTPSLAAVGIIFPAAIFMPRWEPELMSSGAYKYAPYYNPRADMESILKSGSLVYFKEGATTTVSVRKQHGTTALAVDGKVDATDSGDMTTQKMLGHLPLLLSDKVQNVAIIGLGSGVTAGSVLQYPIRSLDVVEISPEVAQASDFFKHVSHDPLRDPRTHLIIGDGRNHLRYIGKTYDVIISEPSNPWMSGMASLFSREFFQEDLARLTPKGIHCQWVHSYNMATSDLRSIIATFRSVFPHSQLWALNQNDFLLMGSPSPIEISGEVLSRNFSHASDDLKSFGLVDLYSLASLYMLEDADLDAFASGAALNTDPHPILEFHAPRFIYANTSDENFAALTAAHKNVPVPEFVRQIETTATAENHRNKGEMYLKSDSFGEAIEEFKQAIAANVEDQESWNGALKASRSLHVRSDLKPFIEHIAQTSNSNTARLAAAEFYSQEGNNGKAVELVRAALETDPRNVPALEKLASFQVDQGSTELPGTVERLLNVDPDNALGLYQLATVRFYQGRLDEAIQLAKRSLSKDPENPRAGNLLAIVYGQTFQHDLADAQFRKCIQDFPGDWLTLNNYGLFLLERGRPLESVDVFKKAIELNPENVQAFVGLGEANRQAGRAGEANHWYRIALQLDPNQAVAKQYIR
jgi:spermidine synthase